ncbi:MAG: discoidin domain-containing protein [Phycisphaerae bacterium]|nr:discoidin domain-containing protein [Phycisphaerae bacterium]
MSKSLVIAVCCLMSLMTWETAYGFNANTDPSLVGLWTLDETEGPVAVDSSPNGNDGTLNGNAAWTQGYLGGAISLDGTNSYVDFGASDIFNLTEQVTLALWIKPYDLNNGQHNHWLGKGDHAYAIKHNLNNNIEFFVYDAGDWHSVNYTGYDDSYNGEWHHMAGTYDGTTLTIYVDGILGIEAAYAGGIAVSTHSVRIGENSEATGRYTDGIIDDARIYSRALTLEEIQSVMTGGGNPALASGPVPAVDAEDVWYDGSILTWVPGESAVAHDVYFGGKAEDVNNASRNNDLSVLVSQGQAASEYALAPLDFGQVYYWRVDEVNAAPDNTIFKGEVWSFTAESYSIMIPVDVNNATASSSVAKNPPSMTVNGSGLNGDTHSTNGETMWLSASPDLTPWLMYEFDRPQKLDHMLIWNSNSGSEAFVGWGIKDINIEYSIDGVNWTVLAESIQINRAPGEPTYGEPQIVDLGLIQAKVVKIDILNNWGGLLKQYGVSEVQFYGLPVYARSPGPASGEVDVNPDTIATWRSGREAAQHTVYVSQDANAVADSSATSKSSMANSIDLGTLDLQLGETYYWRVDEVNEAEMPSVWAGSMWNLSTPSTLMVDDFEIYSNFSPNRPFQTWLDGYGYSADEFFPVEYPGNGTGSGVGHDIWGASSPHFEGQIMEVTLARSGSQSLPFYYTAGTTSQIDRKWSTPQDWSGHGIQTLAIFFYGTTGNTGQLYVKINNTRINYPGDASNLTRLRWNPWYIDLSAQSVSSVTTLSIGVDGASASGMLLLDDIRLSKSAPDMVTPIAPSTEGLVAHWKLDDGAGTTAADSAGSAPGTIQGAVQWTSGHLGGALQLDGLTTYVDCGTGAAFDITDVVSLSVWVKPMDAGNGENNPYIAKGDHTYAIKHAANNNFQFFVQNAGTWYSANVPVTDGFNDNWYHLAGTFDGRQAKIYVNGILSGITDYEGPIASMTHAVNLGRNSENTDRLYEGVIDDARIYHRVLSEAEILYLSNQ